MFIFLFYNSAMLRFTSSSRAARCLQPKGSTQGLWLEQIWEVWHFQPHFHRHLFAGDPELTQPCFITGDSLRRSLWDCLCPALPLQLQALCGAQSWAGLIREECSALHAIAITLLMTPVSLSGFLSFSTTAIFSTDDCLLWQSDCEAALEPGLLSVVLGKEQNRLPASRIHPTERCCQMYKKCTSTGVMHQSILAMLGSFTNIRLWELQLSFATLASFVLPLPKAQWLAGLIQWEWNSLSSCGKERKQVAVAAISDSPCFFLPMEPIYRSTPALKEEGLTVKLIERGSPWHALPDTKSIF